MRSRAVWSGSAIVSVVVPIVAVASLWPRPAYTFSGERHGAERAVPQTGAEPARSTTLTQSNLTSRPAGSLVMSIHCGAFGALPAFSGTSMDWPGFPRSLAEEQSIQVSSGEQGTDGCLSTLHSVESIKTDDGGPGSLVSAWGRLDQITVLDTRDDDTGWTLSGSASVVVAADGDRWAGDYVGWIPSVTHDSARIPTGDHASYDQTVRAGAIVLPGTGVLSGDGLGSGAGNTLASAAPGAGLGEATIDGRLLLAVPDAPLSGSTYTTVITLTLI